MLEKADMARRSIKGLRGNHYAIYTDDLKSEQFKEEETISEVYDAVRNNDIEICYMPRIKDDRESIVGCKAVPRVQLKDGHVLESDELTRLIERGGRLSSFALATLSTVCCSVGAWKKLGNKIVPFSIEMTASELSIHNVVRKIDDIVVEKKSKSPDEDKSLADSKALLPTLKDFKTRHPDINPTVFLGDAAFDTIEIYKSLFEDFNFKKAFIPLKVKLSMDNVNYTFNEDGIPCCPHDPSLPMKREGSKSNLRSKLPTMKFVCPKMKWEYNRQNKSSRRVCHCDNPCTTSSCGRMIYVYPEKNLRAYPGVERGSKEWDETYKIRVNVEKSINHFKDSFCVANRKTTNEKTLHADLLLSGISQLLTVVVADKINQRQHIRSLKSFIA